MNLTVLIYVLDRKRSILIHTLAQLFSPSNSVARKYRISDSAIDSRSLDTNAPNQYGELSQLFGSSKNYDIMLYRKVVLTNLIYSSPSRLSPLKMGTLKAGIFDSVFLMATLPI